MSLNPLGTRFRGVRCLIMVLMGLVCLCTLFLFVGQPTVWAVGSNGAHGSAISASSAAGQSVARQPKGKGAKNGKKGGKKRNALKFPCSDKSGPGGTAQPDPATIQADWLTGDQQQANAGHLMFTSAADTYAQPQIGTLFAYTEGIAFLLITPSLVLLGYQLMLSAVTFRYASALEGISRVVFAVVGIVISFQLVQMLITFENTITGAVVLLHSQHPYPQTQVNGSTVPYMLPGAPAGSYAGIVVPITRWGCAANSFLGLVSRAFLKTTLGTVIPIIGDFVRLAGKVKDIGDLVQRIGQLVLTALSLVLWGQLFLRLLFLNYYILITPLAFGCWGLPGGVGQNVVRLWLRGFLTVLLIQILQLFILTTLPLLLPSLPQIPFANGGVLQSILLQFPPILTLLITILAPRLLGASTEKILSTTGSITGIAISAVSHASLAS